MGIRSLISYEGTTAMELASDFHEAIDDYLALCEAEHKEPEKAYKGSFNVRISPQLHREAAVCAAAQQKCPQTLRSKCDHLKDLSL